MAPKLGILAGEGELPLRLRDHCLRQGREVVVVAFTGHTDPRVPEGVEHIWTRLGAGGSALQQLRSTGVRELVLAGAIKRPSLPELRPDLKTLKFLTRIGAVGLGDDGILHAVIMELEREGFTVVGADDVFSDILAGDGIWGQHQPDAQAWQDIERGIEVSQSLGLQDIGQSVVVQQGLILGVEAIEGTDALIRRCGELRREGPGGVLIKLKKPEQERRADLPTVGPVTARNAVAAGLRGIAIEAGGTLVLDREEVIEIADSAGLFVIGIEVPQ